MFYSANENKPLPLSFVAKLLVKKIYILLWFEIKRRIERITLSNDVSDWPMIIAIHKSIMPHKGSQDS